MLFCANRNGCPNIMKIFIVPLFHEKSSMHQQAKVKEADKIIKDKYDLNETTSMI